MNEKIYIGNKPVLTYVTAVLLKKTENGGKPVEVIGRGRNICRVVDTVEIIKRQLSVKEKKISIKTEKTPDGNNVSVMSIII
jgi:DNA-binding protein Alba